MHGLQALKGKGTPGRVKDRRLVAILADTDIKSGFEFDAGAAAMSTFCGTGNGIASCWLGALNRKSCMIYFLSANTV